MALPTLGKTWQVKPNLAGGLSTTNLEDHQRTLYAIKNALCTFATAPWTVSRSSNSTSAGTDDWWNDYYRLIWAASGAHSWIVLKSPGAAGYEILLDLLTATASPRLIDVWISPSGGFSGGSTTTRPTASDELQLKSDAAWLGQISTGAFTTKVHVIHSTDGECSRVVVFDAGVPISFWLLDRAKNPVAGWSFPYIVQILTGSSAADDCMDYATAAGSAWLQSVYSSALVSFWLTSEGYGVASNAQLGAKQVAPNDLTSENPLCPIGLVSESAGFRGRHGELFDLWWGGAWLNSGDQYPDNGTLYQFSHCGDMIIPWDSSTTMQTA